MIIKSKHFSATSVILLRTSLILLVIAILRFSAAESVAQKLRRFLPQGAYGKPNVILLSADGFGYRDFEVIKKSPSDFPNLTTLISNSIVFTRFYNSDFKAVGVYSSYLFGFQYTAKQNQQSANEPAGDKLPLAKALKECEYFTGILGKWCIGDEINQPVKIGFDQWFGYLTPQESTNLFPLYLWRNDKRFHLSENQGGAKAVPAQRWFNTTTTNFLRIYREYAFFLYLPSVLPGSDSQSETQGVDKSETQGVDKKAIKSVVSEDRRKSIKELDAYVGLILNYLKIFRIQDKTIIILTGVRDAEDGLKSTEKQAGLKQISEIIEAKLHVPMIVSWEGTIKSAITNDSLLTSYDIYPTILQLADGKVPTNSCEYSFAQELTGKTNMALPEFVFWKMKEGAYDWVIRLNGYYVGYSEKDKAIDLQVIDNEKNINSDTEKVRRDITEFINRINKGLPRTKPEKR